MVQEVTNSAPIWEDEISNQSIEIGETLTVFLPGFIDQDPSDSLTVSLLTQYDFLSLELSCFCLEFNPVESNYSGTYSV